MKWLASITLLFLCVLRVDGQGGRSSPFGKYETVYLGVEDGLSQGSVYSMLRDSRGFMWFTSYEGLNRYDGHRFEVFYPNTSKAGSIIGKLSNGIVEDSLGNIWVGTEECLNQYERKSGLFRQVFARDSLDTPLSSLHYPFYTDSVSVWYINTEEGVVRYHFHSCKKELITGAVRYSRNYSRINSTVRTKDGSVWVRQELGVVRILPGGGLCSYFSPREDNVLGQPNHLVCFFEDSQERIWLGTQDTLLELLPEEKRYRAIPLARWGIHTKIGDIRESPRGYLWMGTVDKGILIYDKEKDEILQTIQQEQARETSLRNNSAASLYFDQQGLCWVNNDPDGITFIRPDFSPFNRRGPFFFAQYQLGSAGVRAFTEAPDGSVWIGMEQGGLCHYNPEQGKLLRIINTAHGYPFPENQCGAIAFGEDGRLWAGTQNGLYCLDLRDGRWRHMLNTADKELPPSSQLIWDMQPGPDGFIVFTTDLGVYVLDPRKEKFRAIPGLKEISSGILYMDEQQQLYIPEYYNGFYLMDWAEVLGEGAPKARHFLPGVYIKSFYREPGSQTLWLATADGLMKMQFDRSETSLEQVEAYAQAEGLPSNYIYSVLPDEKGALWLTHNRGLSRFDPRTKSFVNYGPEDGLQGYEYNTNAFLRTSRGELFFGGVQGFNHFFPGQVQVPPLPPPPQFTRLFVNDTLCRAFGNIAEAGAIILPYRDNTITLEFTSTNYLNPRETVYQYYLEGQEESWINAGTQASARYSNLQEGAYTFFVRAGNKEGRWNEEPAALQITISPPWWRSWGAYLCYGLFLAGLGYALFTIRLRSRLRKAEAGRYEELNRWKSDFYVNITHEFRTPLSLILGMAGRLPAENQERTIIQQNGRRLLTMVNQLLELNKLKDGALEVQWSQSDIMQFLRNTAEPFRLLAREKGIQFQIKTTPEALNMDFDPGKMDTILSNLLSNAIKFCEKGNTILAEARYMGQEGASRLELKIWDDGPGIEPETLKHIFNRYYQGASLRHTGEGTGIGLTMVKELTTLMKGKIMVSSQRGTGASFLLYFPVGQAAPPWNGLTPARTTPASEASGALPISTIGLQEERPNILIVEDHADMAAYIGSVLEERYNVFYAGNGEEGLHKARQIGPSAVVSDVMMPRMDGFEFCRRLKEDRATSHIPVVLLTAKAGQQSRKKGWRFGADAYLPKPFDPEEVLLCIGQMVRSRLHLQEKYRILAGLPAPLLEEGLDNKEVDFLKTLNQALEMHIEEKDFKVASLCRVLGMNHVSLNNKIKALCGATTAAYMRSFRLRQALRLLENNSSMSIAQVAYSVGISDPANFTRMFKEEFGTLPSEVER